MERFRTLKIDGLLALSSRILGREEPPVPDYKLLTRESVLDALDEELRERGFVGPTDVSQLVFLALTTRHFDKPVSLVIKGSSGSGKSYALASALQFVPPAAYEMFAGLSERALLYLPGLKLKNKHLIIQEAAGLSDGQGRVFLRQLLTEGRVRYATVQSTKNGNVGKELPPLEGPTGLLMTTTANTLHREDETRMLSYTLNEDPEKMREAMVRQALMQAKPPKPLDTEPWFALDRMVSSGDKRVTIPFLDELARSLPITHNRVMRDFAHIRSLIQAHALVHQCRRGRALDGSIMATLDDYAAVHRLVATPLSEGLEAAVPPNVREVVEAVRRLVGNRPPRMPFDPDPAGVSQREVAEELHRDRSVISRNVAIAVDQGFLIDENPGRGREASLVPGPRELPTGSALPDPAVLKVDPEPRFQIHNLVRADRLPFTAEDGTMPEEEVL